MFIPKQKDEILKSEIVSLILGEEMYLNEGITKCLDTYYNINIVHQQNCFYYTR